MARSEGRVWLTVPHTVATEPPNAMLISGTNIATKLKFNLYPEAAVAMLSILLRLSPASVSNVS